jgi:hypothetical protein
VSVELEHAQQELEQILGGLEYQIYHVERPWSFITDWLARVREGLMASWSGVFPERADLASGFSYFSILVLVLCFGLFIFVLVRVLQNVSVGTLWREQVPGGALHRQSTPKMYLREAERWAGEQDYEQAMRALFTGLLIFLDEKGWIETKAWKTNGEYFRELQSKGKEATDMFGWVAGNYEETVYGSLPLKPEIYRLCQAQVESCFREEAPQ